LLAGGIASSEFFRKLLKGLFGVKKKPEKSYGERLAKLTANLNDASSEVDSVLEELARVAHNRESTVKRLEADLQSLEERENELREKIALLENVPIPVAEQFAKLLARVY
jgi:predicted  nucleic acid-binding Zn-ribbon protein